jgi:GntR family transcriptional regulator
MDEMEIVDHIISQIQKDHLAPLDKLPSENELADRYNVPRIKVRKAYERLQEMGYIISKQGKGSYVKERQGQIELVLSGDVSFSQKMKEQGIPLETTNIYCKKINFNKKIYQLLGVDDTEGVYKIARLRIVSGTPTAVHISYVAESVFPTIEQDGKNITSMFAYYHQQGYEEFYSKASVLTIAFPTKHERKVLNCANLIPLLVVVSACLDRKTDKVLECTKIIYRTDCFKYIVPV